MDQSTRSYDPTRTAMESVPARSYQLTRTAKETTRGRSSLSDR